jgi:hypothetical protein
MALPRSDDKNRFQRTLRSKAPALLASLMPSSVRLESRCPCCHKKLRVSEQQLHQIQQKHKSTHTSLPSRLYSVCPCRTKNRVNCNGSNGRSKVDPSVSISTNLSVSGVSGTGGSYTEIGGFLHCTSSASTTVPELLASGNQV